MRYILRHVVLSYRWEEQLRDVIALCERSDVDEVMLMEQSHQIVVVPFPLEKHREMAGIYRQYGAALRDHGVDYSVNLATIVGHADAPVTGKWLQPFTRFVGEDLEPLNAVYCIGDPEWVAYAQRVVELYAATGPTRLMVDDDFRSLNHTVTTGCFCVLHVEQTAQELGDDALTARSLRDALLADDDRSLAVKAAWQRVNFRMQIAAATAIESAIHRVDPTVQVGLMNSGEQAHSLQGRDMPALLRAFAGPDNQPLSRPAGGAYADSVHEDVVAMHQVSALSKHVAGDAFWVSEVENWPHSRYIKSAAITELQMKVHALWGADALTLNLYDYLGTPFGLEGQWERLLVDLRPDLQRIAGARAGLDLAGVGLPWKKEVSAHQRNRSRSIAGLMPRRPLDTLLPLLGIPVQFAPAAVTAILGDDLQAYSDAELDELLSKGLIVDHVAAGHLIARGKGELVGGRLVGTVEGPVVERLTHPDFAGAYMGCDLATDWFRLAPRGQGISRWEAAPGAIVASTYFTDEGEPVSPAVSLFGNSLGGRVAVFAQDITELGWLHLGRASQLRAVIAWLAGGSAPWPMVEQGPNVAPFLYRAADGGGVIALVNTGLDSVLVDVAALGVASDLYGECAQTVSVAPLTMWMGRISPPSP